VELIYSPAAIRALRSMPGRDAAALVRKLERVAAAPFATYPWAKPLKGGGYRVRQGDWRAVYNIDRETDTLRVDLIGNRREVYR